MDIGCLHSQFSRTAFLRSKGKNPRSKFDLLGHGTWQGLSSLDSFKNSCDRLTCQRKFGISSQHLTRVQALVIECNHPQNSDFPRYYSKKEKKPFPIPIVELRRAARERLKNRNNQPRGIPPPKRGLVVERLIPVAYKVLNARITLVNNLKKLLKVMPVNACKWCSEIHVGPVGHPFKSCRGPQASIRKGAHEWVEAVVEDMLVPVEAYHLYDRLGKRISHEERFSIPRIPAVVELCIQAGVDLPEYPTKRRKNRIGRKEFIDADESELPDPDPDAPKPEILAEIVDSEIVPPSCKEDTTLLAEETLKVHVGPTGHKAQNCGAHKHQQRNGQHGWQAAVLDDLIPPKFVWHVPDVNKPLERDLRNFYGQAPAVVELCVQAGAAVPEKYKPTMRLDVGIPTDVREAEMVV
ncbi:UNVERIFIED_CONTAM: APO protein 2, chloroplastic [Sesamum radiatum]|uniref:APO protein 2, chloroplastic n=1 Tax=Sesamum radiatum TaxID=300843 RepID=A0AAW2NBJ7_SESRA